MPFKKIGKDRYVSESGREYTGKQVALYYATDGFRNLSKEPKRKPRGLRPRDRRMQP